MIPAAALLVEDSGGLSLPDAQKISIYGGSTRWTRWYVDGLDLTDALFPGAALLRVPRGLVTGVSLVHAEDPARSSRDGVALSTGPVLPLAEGQVGRAGLSTVLPDAGGSFPGAEAVTRAFSTTHPTDRSPTPPGERRRFGAHHHAHASAGLALASDARVDVAAEVDVGERRFLTFGAAAGESSGILEEPFTIASAGLRYSTPGGPTYLILGEVRSRDHLFAELRHAPAETARMERATLFAGWVGRSARAGLGLQHTRVDGARASMTRELLDLDGEGVDPYFPSGQVFSGTLSADWQDPEGPAYLALEQAVVGLVPSRARFETQLLVDGAPAGRLLHSSAGTLQLFGEPRAGIRGAMASGAWALGWDAHLGLAYAATSSLENGLLLPGTAAEVTLSFRLAPELTPHLSLSRAPIPIEGGLVQALDPRWLATAHHLHDGALIDRTGGDNITVAGNLRRAHVHTAALGLESRLGEEWRLEAQGILRVYDDLYRLELDGGAAAHGYWSEGRYFLRDGAHGYRLVNGDGGQLPFFTGLELQLLHRSPGLLFGVAFSMMTAVGNTAFGNGPTSNDLGVVDESTASPNAAIFGLANLDADRAFVLEAFVSWEPSPGLSFLANARHKDGQPFAFFDASLDRGRVALAYTSNRGSPLQYERPLAGPREDFQLEVDLEVRFTSTLGEVPFALAAAVSNTFDLGNELGERNDAAGREGRAALELQVPRALHLGVEVGL